MGGLGQILEPLLRAFAGDDHRNRLEVSRFIFQIQIIELNDLFRGGIGSVAEECKDIRRLIVIADVTDQLSFVLPSDVRDGNRHCGGADCGTGNNVGRRRERGEEERKDQ